MRRWLQRMFARLSWRRRGEVTPLRNAQPAQAEAPPAPSIWEYKVVVGLPGERDETHHQPSPNPLHKDELFEFGAGRMVKVVEILEEAQPGVKVGRVRVTRAVT